MNIFLFMVIFNSFSLIAADTSGIAKENSNILQQSHTVRGFVVDEEGNPLPGVTIIVEGSTRGVSTDIDGSYSIDVKPTDKLVFSFVGLETRR